MLAERSLRPLPPSPAQSRPSSPRDYHLCTGRASSPRPLPLPAAQHRAQSAIPLCRRPLPVPPGETDALAPLRRASEPSGSTITTRGLVASPRRAGLRPLPTPVTTPFLTPETSPLLTPATTPDGTVTVFINLLDPEPTPHRPTSTTLSLDDVECFGIRAKSGEHTGQIVKSRSQDFQKEDGGQVQRRITSAARKIIARDKEEQDEAWRAFLAKSTSQNRLQRDPMCCITRYGAHPV